MRTKMNGHTILSTQRSPDDPPARPRPAGGYCECCKIFYRGELDQVAIPEILGYVIIYITVRYCVCWQHVRGGPHQNFLHDNGNYHALDGQSPSLCLLSLPGSHSVLSLLSLRPSPLYQLSICVGINLLILHFPVLVGFINSLNAQRAISRSRNRTWIPDGATFQSERRRTRTDSSGQRHSLKRLNLIASNPTKSPVSGVWELHSSSEDEAEGADIEETPEVFTQTPDSASNGAAGVTVEDFQMSPSGRVLPEARAFLEPC